MLGADRLTSFLFALPVPSYAAASQQTCWVRIRAGGHSLQSDIVAAHGQTRLTASFIACRDDDQSRWQRIPTFYDVPMKPVRLPSRYSVRAAIEASLRDGDASLQRIARQLGISSRSLQRYLAETGTSYSELVAEVRLDTACHLLVQSNERIRTSHCASVTREPAASAASSCV